MGASTKMPKFSEPLDEALTHLRGMMRNGQVPKCRPERERRARRIGRAETHTNRPRQRGTDKARIGERLVSGLQLRFPLHVYRGGTGRQRERMVSAHALVQAGLQKQAGRKKNGHPKVARASHAHRLRIRRMPHSSAAPAHQHTILSTPSLSSTQRRPTPMLSKSIRPSG